VVLNLAHSVIHFKTSTGDIGNLIKNAVERWCGKLYLLEVIATDNNLNFSIKDKLIQI